VFARDGVRCAWQSPDGVRCNSRAWLEHDHIVPRGRGGGNDAANIRPFCRAHNQLAAEQAYGRDTIARIIARRRARRAPIQETAILPIRTPAEPNPQMGATGQRPSNRQR
jgi:hypothetical protein